MTNINITIQPYESLQENVIFVDGLNLEKVKYKYPWLLNAKIKDALIGEDSNGIVWYRGEWLCGEWFSGTWYSGTWHTGTWLDGSFYSYQLKDYDIFDGKFNVLSEGNSFSKFESGYWVNGNFYGGTFGKNEGTNWVDYVFYSGITADGYPVFRNSSEDTYKDLVIATWLDGVFHYGLIYDTLWITGTVRYALITNSMWMNGNFFNGVFDGHSWYNGNWYGGDFIKGTWYNGVFTQGNATQTITGQIKSRFGYTTTATGTTCEWLDGVWKKGEWYSGLVTDSIGVAISSVRHNISIWYGGTWENGIWYGGHFVSGIWKDGIWHGGIFGGDFATNWAVPQYAYNNSNYGTNVNHTPFWDDLDVWPVTGDTPITVAFSAFQVATCSDDLYLSGFTFDFNSKIKNQTINKIQVSVTHKLYRPLSTNSISDNICVNYAWNSAVTHIWKTTNSGDVDFDGKITTVYYLSNNRDIMVSEPLPVSSANTMELGYTVCTLSFNIHVKAVEIYNMQARLYYYNSSRPVWYNGTWNNGIFSGESWTKGKFLKGIWRSGNMIRGDIGS